MTPQKSLGIFFDNLGSKVRHVEWKRTGLIILSRLVCTDEYLIQTGVTRSGCHEMLTSKLRLYYLLKSGDLIVT